MNSRCTEAPDRRCDRIRTDLDLHRRAGPRGRLRAAGKLRQRPRQRLRRWRSGRRRASTVWSNAAGMARLGSAHVVGALNLIQPSLKFSNAASQPAALQPLGSEGGDAGSLAGSTDPLLHVSRSTRAGHSASA